MKLNRPLCKRKGDRLYIQSTNDWFKILSTDGCYPENIIVESANHVRLKFKQVAPNIYARVKEVEDNA